MAENVIDRIKKFKAHNYKVALEALWDNKKISETQRDMLFAQYRAPNHTITASKLARAAGVKGYKAVNLLYGRLAHRLWERLRLPSRGLPSSRGRARWIGVLEPDWSKGRGGQWKGTMHPSLAEAIEQLGWCGSVDTDLPSRLLSTAGGGFGDHEQNVRVERAAVKVVKKSYQSHGWNVESKEQENRGYDLLCTHRSDEHHVEVKGVRGALHSVLITKNEKRAAEHDRAFRLIAVTNALDAKRRRLQVFPGPEFVREFRLSPIAFTATLRKSGAAEARSGRRSLRV
jgi:hypothetical protein